ncbi:ATP-binding cassette sub-family F member 2-like [Clavelina lepadiformis]|uniref:ABC transporter domain-containing protein n=1 Tax=Clavelina lepadiformis TaxID=159417 RepID=A0ABP0G0I4_CLALP
MPSEAAKRRASKKKEAAKNRQRPNKKANEQKAEDISEAVPEKINGISLASLSLNESSAHSDARSCTGVLASHPVSSDLHIHNYSCTYHGQVLFQDTNLELNAGNRYGLIGPNGCGKSTMLATLGAREVPIPDHIDSFYLRHEAPAVEITPLDFVLNVDDERHRLELEAEHLVQADPENEALMKIYERLDELGAETAEVTASRILHGLGFNAAMQKKQLHEFSGGWRMRVSLARALFLKPYLLLLDEPTNHLDLDACVWLEEELKKFKHILVLISHSQDFLNGVCTRIIHMNLKKLNYYTGNYDAFIRTRDELEENQMKRYQKEQDQINHMKDYIARFGHGSAKLARQAQSKEKTLAKMVEKGLTDKVKSDHNFSFYFPECTRLSPPVLMVQNISFRYSTDTPWIYKDVEFGVDMDTRLALVGPNGAGKSTLLKLISGELSPTDGIIRRHSHLKIARYHQHLQDLLDITLTPVEYMAKCYPDIKDLEQLRKKVGKYGISGKQQLCPISKLSDGQKCRVVFAWLSSQYPNLLLLDEPTNHLDIETIDSLADAINDFNGGMILVSHDFRLINQVAKDIWVCENQTITPWKKNIQAYKQSLKKKVINEEKQLLKGKSADHVTNCTGSGDKGKRLKPVPVAPKSNIVGIIKPKRNEASCLSIGKVNNQSQADFWDYEK